MPNEQKNPSGPRRFSRRHFIAAAIAVPVLTTLYTWRVEPHWLEFVYRDLPIANLPPLLVGRRLVQLSDLHIGPQVDDDYLIETFRRVDALQPDIVVHTGDLISYRGGQTIEQARRVLAHCPRGHLGSAAILGNHDYGRDWADPDIASSVEQLLTAAGTTVLRNARTTIAGLHLIGLDDLWAHRFSLGTAFRSFDFNQPALVLSHNPDTCDLPGWSHYDGWILAGHTHGGQCKPPFLPPPLLPVRNKRYTAGEFSLTGGRRLYISRGVGHLLRVRFNVRPEIPVFRLVRA
jgi:predicted MPP superfamily phosphohydrolase